MGYNKARHGDAFTTKPRMLAALYLLWLNVRSWPKAVFYCNLL